MACCQRHSRLIDEKMGSLIKELELLEHDDYFAANLKEMRRKYDEAVKLPTEFVSEFTRVRSEALAWQKPEARAIFLNLHLTYKN